MKINPFRGAGKEVSNYTSRNEEKEENGAAVVLWFYYNVYDPGSPFPETLTCDGAFNVSQVGISGMGGRGMHFNVAVRGKSFVFSSVFHVTCY